MEKREKEDKLLYVRARLPEDGGLEIIFYEDESDFDGNDFEYRYSLDAENTDAFLKTLPHRSSDTKSDVEEWLIENINCKGIGYDLQEKWAEMGLHGRRVVWEDFPGGIYREETF